MGIEEVSAGRIGTLQRDRLKDEFVSRVLDICDDVRIFGLAQSGDTTSTTGKSKGARVITWSKDITTFDTPPDTLGEGYQWDFDGTDEEGDSPDIVALSFGDGATDDPFSIVALVNQDTAEAAVIVAKEASASDEEWVLETDSSGNPQLILTDESASATIGKQDATALSGQSLLVATYDGLSLNSGIGMYLNGISTGDTLIATNAYTAMEAGASKLQVAHHYATPALFWDGKIAFFLVTGKELTADEIWELKTLVNWYYNLSL